MMLYIHPFQGKKIKQTVDFWGFLGGRGFFVVVLLVFLQQGLLLCSLRA